MMDYIRTQPTNVVIMEFSGYRELTDRELRYCAWPLSDECELLPKGNFLHHPTYIAERILPPKIYADNQEIVNGQAGRTLNDCFWECLLGEPVKAVAEVGGGAVASGLIPKAVIKKSGKTLGKASPFTSVPSIVAHYFPGINTQITKMTGNLLTGKAPVIRVNKLHPKVYIEMVPSGTPLRFIGRWIPAIGWGLLAADLIILDQCIAKCRGEKSFLRTAWDELFGIKPAY